VAATRSFQNQLDLLLASMTAAFSSDDLLLILLLRHPLQHGQVSFSRSGL
jgi:hypothetical protein